MHCINRCLSSPLSAMAWTFRSFRFSPLYSAGGITPSGQNRETGKWIQVGVAAEASPGESRRASRSAALGEPRKGHLLATLPAGDAHPAHPHDLACEAGAGFRNASPLPVSLRLLLPLSLGSCCSAAPATSACGHPG